jgi:hypothetical protein
LHQQVNDATRDDVKQVVNAPIALVGESFQLP